MFVFNLQQLAEFREKSPVVQVLARSQVHARTHRRTFVCAVSARSARTAVGRSVGRARTAVGRSVGRARTAVGRSPGRARLGSRHALGAPFGHGKPEWCLASDCMVMSDLAPTQPGRLGGRVPARLSCTERFQDGGVSS